MTAPERLAADAVFAAECRLGKTPQELVSKWGLAWSIDTVKRARLAVLRDGGGTATAVAPNTETPVQDSLSSQLLPLLKAHGNRASVTDLADRLDVSPKRIRECVEHLRSQHKLVGLTDDEGTVEARPPLPRGRSSINTESFFGERIRFGVVSDTHLGSKYAREDVLQALYDIFEREGIETVYHAGNFIDGEARFNQNDIHVHGMGNQVRYFAEHYPQRDGIHTYFIAGDDHEGWYCFDSQCEILTKSRGWQPFADLEQGEAVATMSPAGAFQWQVPTKHIAYPYKGDLIHFSHRSLDFRVTPEHRLLCKTRTRMHGPEMGAILRAREIVDNFKPRCFGIVGACDSWEPESGQVACVHIPRVRSERYGEHPKSQFFDEVSIEDAAELIGWYVTEGCCNKGVVVIAQSRAVNPEEYQQICSLFERMGARYGCSDRHIQVCSPTLAAWLRAQCGEGYANKHLPEWLKAQPRAILRIAFETMIRGDGTFKEHGFKFYSWSDHLRDDMTEIAQKLGYGVTEGEAHHCLSIRAVHKDSWLFERPTIETYNGMVYCVSVPNERIYVRSNGRAFWSMNCQREGVDIGRLAEDVANRTRDDLHYLGYMEHDIELKAEGGSAVLRIQHPGGGASYALSYQPQKIVESLSGGEKPQILLIGHYHKAEYLNYRNVHIVQSGCVMDQSPFMRKKRLAAHVGGWIVEANQSPDGSINRFKTEWLHFFNSEFYTGNWRYQMEG